MKAYFNAALASLLRVQRMHLQVREETQLANPFTSPAKLAGDANAVPTGNYVRSGDRKGEWTQEGVLYSAANPNNPTFSEVSKLLERR